MERTARPGRAKVGWATISRACRGVKVNLSTAKRLARATGGAVPYEALTDDRDADTDVEEVA